MLQKCNKTCMTCCKLACACERAISQENKTGHNNNKYVKENETSKNNDDG